MTTERITLSDIIETHMINAWAHDYDDYTRDVVEYYTDRGWNIVRREEPGRAVYTIPESQLDFFLLSL